MHNPFLRQLRITQVLFQHFAKAVCLAQVQRAEIFSRRRHRRVNERSIDGEIEGIVARRGLVIKRRPEQTARIDLYHAIYARTDARRWLRSWLNRWLDRGVVAPGYQLHPGATTGRWLNGSLNRWLNRFLNRRLTLNHRLSRMLDR
jgi:hypothetical protein